MLFKLADNNKLGDQSVLLKGRAAIQRDLQWLEKWASKNLAESNRQMQSPEQNNNHCLATVLAGDCWAGEQLC